MWVCCYRPSRARSGKAARSRVSHLHFYTSCKLIVTRRYSDSGQHGWLHFVLAPETTAVVSSAVAPAFRNIYKALFQQKSKDKTLWNAFTTALIAEETDIRFVFIFRDESGVHTRIFLRENAGVNAFGFPIRCPRNCMQDGPWMKIRYENASSKKRRAICLNKDCNFRVNLTLPEWLYSLGKQWYWADYPLQYPSWPSVGDMKLVSPPPVAKAIQQNQRGQ